MSQIQISLEGISAIAFAQALEGLPGYEVSYAVEDSSVVTQGETSDKFARVLITVKAIMDLTGQTIQTAEQGLSFVEHLKNFQSPPVPLVLVISGDQEIEVKNATPEQIVKIIQDANK
jgi:hypothetical protein